METNFGQDLIESLGEAIEHAAGQVSTAKVHVVHVPDVRGLRERLKMSQQTFARAYRIPLATLKGWEQGRRQPDATAAAYLSVIERLPDEARAALEN